MGFMCQVMCRPDLAFLLKKRKRCYVQLCAGLCAERCAGLAGAQSKPYARAIRLKTVPIQAADISNRSLGT